MRRVEGIEGAIGSCCLPACPCFGEAEYAPVCFGRDPEDMDPLLLEGSVEVVAREELLLLLPPPPLEDDFVSEDTKFETVRPRVLRPAREKVNEAGAALDFFALDSASLFVVGVALITAGVLPFATSAYDLRFALLLPVSLLLLGSNAPGDAEEEEAPLLLLPAIVDALYVFVFAALGTLSGFATEKGILPSDEEEDSIAVAFANSARSSGSNVEKYSSIICHSTLRLYARHDLRSMTDLNSSGNADALIVFLLFSTSVGFITS